MTKINLKPKGWIKLLFCIGILGTCIGCGHSGYESYVLAPNEKLMEEGDEDSLYSPDETATQLTAEDLMSMNNGDAQLVYSNEGYLTFLNGKYYDKKITDHEDAVASLNGISKLLGLGAGCEFFAKYGETDDDGYTYYVFQQRYGDATVQFATLRVIVDPEGYTAGLSSSFTPNLGIAESKEAITPEEALEILKAYWTKNNLQFTYYPESTAKVALTYNEQTINCYALYTNNPAMNKNFDMPYYEHFISYEGNYIYKLPVASLSTDNFDTHKASSYFEGLEKKTYSGEVSLFDGTTRHIEVPIAYNPKDGLYYLGDVDRKIMVADFYAFAYQNQALDFMTSTDGKSWNNMDLITYSNYITAYEFYKARGLQSIDGFSVPILLCVNYCDQNQTPIDNCCHFGINKGWACFAASTGYNNSEGLDVIGHEYTHGVTSYSMGGIHYVNSTGAINESYSDIMGNIMEMLTGYTDDQTWLIGEKNGHVWRSMSSPRDYKQPVSLSDSYYYPPTTEPDSRTNDNGGVHINSSLLNSVAYKLWKGGMSLEEEASLWVTSIELLTPYSDYKDIYAALLMSLEINGFSNSYKQLITDAFNDAELLG